MLINLIKIHKFEFENLADLILIGDYLNNTLAILEWTAITIFLKERIKKDIISLQLLYCSI